MTPLTSFATSGELFIVGLIFMIVLVIVALATESPADGMIRAAGAIALAMMSWGVVLDSNPPLPAVLNGCFAVAMSTLPLWARITKRGEWVSGSFGEYMWDLCVIALAAFVLHKYN